MAQTHGLPRTAWHSGNGVGRINEVTDAGADDVSKIMT